MIVLNLYSKDFANNLKLNEGQFIINPFKKKSDDYPKLWIVTTFFSTSHQSYLIIC